jgi:hypothetical protein
VIFRDAGYVTGVFFIPSGHFLVQKYDAVHVMEPERFTVGAFDDVPGIAVGMDVDLDPGCVVTNRAVHGYLSLPVLFLI